MNHEYTVLGGINRAVIGRYIATVAAIISAGLVFLLLQAVNVAKQFGVAANLPPTILPLVSAGAVFSVLYWLFDRLLWKHLASLLKVPVIAGEWTCIGTSLNPDGTTKYEWNGTVTILQSWDKLRVRLRTAQSGSNSVTAACVYDEADGYRLLYNYRNDPKIGEPDLKSHLGFAELLFDQKLTSATGEYFNGHGRYTFGTMKLEKANG